MASRPIHLKVAATACQKGAWMHKVVLVPTDAVETLEEHRHRLWPTPGAQLLSRKALGPIPC
eukprot:2091957-Alexandrium_andersonii.AAC.1